VSREVLSDLGIWLGAILGSLTVLDWLLLDEHKAWLTRKLEDAWLWLAQWRLDALLWILRTRYFHRAVGVFSVAWSVAFFGSAIMQFGWGRHPFQFWLYFAVTPVITIALAFVFYTRSAAWLVSASTTRQYLKRACGLAFLLNLGTTAVLWLVLSSRIPPYIIENDLGPLLFSFLSPLIVIQSLFYLSFSWLGLSTGAMALIKALQFILFRVIAHSKGPVLGASGLLVGLGAIVKALTS
jgi:hypothetical protein